MPYFYESLSDTSKQKFKKLAIKLVGPSWQPVTTKYEANMYEAKRIMEMTPEKFKQVEGE